MHKDWLHETSVTNELPGGVMAKLPRKNLVARESCERSTRKTSYERSEHPHPAEAGRLFSFNG